MAAPTSYSNYKTNVGRSVTKKWKEANQINYDGDDWGDDDDYDDQPAPAAPAAQPPSSIPASAGPTRPPQPLWERQPARSFTNPVPPPPAPSQNYGRPSFDRGDDRRQFLPSAGFGSAYPTTQRSPFPEPQHDDLPQHPAFRDQPPLRLNSQPQSPPGSFRPSSRGSSRGRQYPPYNDPAFAELGGLPQPPFSPQQRRSGSSGRPAPGDIYQRHESPVRPDSRGSNMSARQFPPRKASLSQQTSPADSSRSLHDAANTEPAAISPKVEDRPIPAFIRPSDIYKQIPEALEKVRKSHDSSRPSIESATPRRFDAADGQPVSAESKDLVKDLPSPSTQSPDDSDSARRHRSPLDIVVERKSEYGFDNLQQEPTAKPSAIPPRQPIEQRMQPDQAQTEGVSRHSTNASSVYTDRPDPVSASTVSRSSSVDQEPLLAPSAANRASYGLPSLGRLSSFGLDLGSFGVSSSDTPSSIPQIPQPASTDPGHRETSTSSTNLPSQHQLPFDSGSIAPKNSDERRKDNPLSPISDSGESYPSNSVSASAISPIANSKTQPVASTTIAAYMASGVIPEEDGPNASRPTSTATLKAPPAPSKYQVVHVDDSQPNDGQPDGGRASTPTSATHKTIKPFVDMANTNSQVPQHVTPVRKEPVALEQAADPQISVLRSAPDQETFLSSVDVKASGDQSTPNSPAEKRLPPLPHPQPEPQSTVEQPSTERSTSEEWRDWQAHRKQFNEQAGLDSGASTFGSPSPNIRPGTPPKGTVREITDRLESNSGRSTPAISSLATNSPTRDPVRPLAQARLDSFRPSIPGGWQSFSSTPGASTPNLPSQANQAMESSTEQATGGPTNKGSDGVFKQLPVPSARPSLLAGSSPESTDSIPTAKAPARPATENDGITQKAFAAAATAGTALAGAFTGQRMETSTSDVPDVSPTRSEISSENEWDASSDSSQDLDEGVPRLTSSESQHLPTATSTPLSHPSAIESNVPHATLEDIPAPLRTSKAFDTSPMSRPAVPVVALPNGGTSESDNEKLQRSIVQSLTPKSSTFGFGATDSVTPSTTVLENTGPSMIDQTALPSAQGTDVRETGVLHSQEPSTASADLGTEPQPFLQKRFSWETESEQSTPAITPKPTNTSGANFPTTNRGREPSNPGPTTAPQNVNSGPSLTHDAEKRLPPLHVSQNASSSSKSPAQHTWDDKPASTSFASVPVTNVAEQDAARSDIPNTKQQTNPANSASAVGVSSTSHPTGLRQSNNPQHTATPATQTGPVLPGPERLSHLSDSSDQPPIRAAESTPPPAALFSNATHTDSPWQSGTGNDNFVGQSVRPSRNSGELISFRAIMNLSTPQERIVAFNEMRRHESVSDGKLEDWLHSLNTPEHSELFASNGRISHDTPESQSGYKPSPRRILSESVGSRHIQEDGKKLIAKAGRFGGKAGSAAKGLFARGKEKMRTASSGEKGRRKSTGVSSTDSNEAQTEGLSQPRESESLDGPPQIPFTLSPASPLAIEQSDWFAKSAPNQVSLQGDSRSLTESMQVDSTAPSSQQDGLNERITPAHNDMLTTKARHSPSSPAISALDDAADAANDFPSRSVSQITRPTADDSSIASPLTGTADEDPNHDLVPIPAPGNSDRQNDKDIHIVSLSQPAEKALPDVSPIQAGLQVRDDRRRSVISDVSSASPSPGPEGEAPQLRRSVSPADEGFRAAMPPVTNETASHEPIEQNDSPPVYHEVVAEIVDLPPEKTVAQQSPPVTQTSSAAPFIPMVTPPIEQEPQHGNTVSLPEPSDNSVPIDPTTLDGHNNVTMMNQPPEPESLDLRKTSTQPVSPLSQTLSKAFSQVSVEEITDTSNFTTSRQSRSYSRPFGADPNVRNHPAFKEAEPQEPPLDRTQMYSTEATPVSQSPLPSSRRPATELDQLRQQKDQLLQPNATQQSQDVDPSYLSHPLDQPASRDGAYRIPGPYIQNYRSPKQITSSRAGRSDTQIAASGQPLPSALRAQQLQQHQQAQEQQHHIQHQQPLPPQGQDFSSPAGQQNDNFQRFPQHNPSLPSQPSQYHQPSYPGRVPESPWQSFQQPTGNVPPVASQLPPQKSPAGRLSQQSSGRSRQQTMGPPPRPTSQLIAAEQHQGRKKSTFGSLFGSGTKTRNKLQKDPAGAMVTAQTNDAKEKRTSLFRRNSRHESISSQQSSQEIYPNDPMSPVGKVSLALPPQGAYSSQASQQQGPQSHHQSQPWIYQQSQQQQGQVHPGVQPWLNQQQQRQPPSQPQQQQQTQHPVDHKKKRFSALGGLFKSSSKVVPQSTNQANPPDRTAQPYIQQSAVQNAMSPQNYKLQNPRGQVTRDASFGNSQGQHWPQNESANVQHRMQQNQSAYPQASQRPPAHGLSHGYRPDFQGSQTHDFTPRPDGPYDPSRRFSQQSLEQNMQNPALRGQRAQGPSVPNSAIPASSNGSYSTAHPSNIEADRHRQLSSLPQQRPEVRSARSSFGVIPEDHHQDTSGRVLSSNSLQRPDLGSSPYPPSASPHPSFDQRRPADLRIDTATPDRRNRVDYPNTAPVQVYPQYPARESFSSIPTTAGVAKSLQTSPLSNRTLMTSPKPPLTAQDQRSHVVDLHKRSRSPKLGRRSSEDLAAERRNLHAGNDLAGSLGTFSNKRISPVGGVARAEDDQERPFAIGLPPGFAEDEQQARSKDSKTRDRVSALATLERGHGEGYRQGHIRTDTPVSVQSLNEPDKSDNGTGTLARATQQGTADGLVSRSGTTAGGSQDPKSQARSMNKSSTAVELPGSKPDGYESEEEVVMSATAYPGQEWMPVFVGDGRWDD